MSGREPPAVRHGSVMPLHAGQTADDDPAEAAPIALPATAVGARAGILAALPVALPVTLPVALPFAMLAGALLVLSLGASGEHLSPAGWAARAVPLLLVGAVLSAVTDCRRRTDAHLVRQAERARVHRAASIELNDSIVQGLTAIKWSLEAGDTQQALALTSEHLERGHRLVSDLIRDAGVAGDWTGTSSQDTAG